MAPPPLPGPAPWMPECVASPQKHAPPPGAGGAPAMAVVEGQALAELAECCRELEEGQRACPDARWR